MKLSDVVSSIVCNQQISNKDIEETVLYLVLEHLQDNRTFNKIFKEIQQAHKSENEKVT